MFPLGYYGMFWDPTYILVIIGAVLCMMASSHVNSTYQKYARVRSMSGMTGAQAAERLLCMNGIYDVTIGHVRGDLSDHYNPSSRVLNLSDATYGASSVAALGVAAHECGHALQHANGYIPLRIRGAMVPVVNFASYACWPILILGLFFRSNSSALLIQIGIAMFLVVVLFQLVTLPVEFDASRRGLQMLESAGVLGESELRDAGKVLRAAALTYVASAASAILQLLRILMIFGGRNRD